MRESLTGVSWRLVGLVFLGLGDEGLDLIGFLGGQSFTRKEAEDEAFGGAAENAFGDVVQEVVLGLLSQLCGLIEGRSGAAIHFDEAFVAHHLHHFLSGGVAGGGGAGGGAGFVDASHGCWAELPEHF